MKNKVLPTVTVIGAGLAGCEAAFLLARQGINVELVEMKPEKKTPAHTKDYFCELVCSNSLRSDDETSASGLLKSEMRKLGSLILDAADSTRVPAGGALAVDRDKFGQLVSERIRQEKRIKIVSAEQVEIPAAPAIIASGPLTSEPLSRQIMGLVGNNSLYFFDAAAPIIAGSSIDMSRAFIQDRYNKGSGDYINCPLTKEEYEIFYSELLAAKTAEVKDFERNKVFEGCVPIEVLAARGRDTMRFGPLKPVGLVDPATGKRPYAVVQLRKENEYGEMYNIVGFQTKLLWGEQRRVFSLIPALKNAEFLRLGVMHKNTFINSPLVLSQRYNLREYPDIFFAGQITGVEGYIESASSGLLAAINLVNRLKGNDEISYTNTTAITSLACYIANGGSGSFQPMNINFGLFAPLESAIRDKTRRKEAIVARAKEDLEKYFGAFRVKM